jgi:hypothetical protein
LIDRSDEYTLKEGGRRYMLKWKGECPCCYDCVLPEVPPVTIFDPPLEVPFADLHPRIERCTIELETVEMIDPKTGNYYTFDVMIVVDTTVDEVLEQKQTDRSQSRLPEFLFLLVDRASFVVSFFVNGV